MKITEENCVALYCSRLNDCELLIDEQMSRLKRYCRHFDLEIVEEYIETSDNRCIFNKLLKDIESKRFNIVLSYSFDTISQNDEELETLIKKLQTYRCELNLESTYEYIPECKPLFKVPLRNHEEEQRNYQIPKKKRSVVPIFKTYEVKNLKLKEPIDWVKMFDEDTIRFEINELFDDEGNYLGFKRDVYVVRRECVGFCNPRKNQKSNKKTGALW